MSVGENPTPGFSKKPSYIPKATIWSPDVGVNLARIKGVVHDHWGTCGSQVNVDGKIIYASFQIPTMLQWMRGWLKVIELDESRKKIDILWDPDVKTELGVNGVRRRMRSRWADCIIIIFAHADDTLPNEKDMTDEELMLFDGTL